MTTTVAQYLADGCMRCKYGATPQCKVHRWLPELQLLRQIVLDTQLQEEVKWGVPVYTFQGKNIVSVNALKDSANLSFFKGVLLTDPHQLLQQQGTIHAGRIIKFTSTAAILQWKEVLTQYIFEAVVLEEKGTPLPVRTQQEPMPAELLEAFAADPALEAAFNRLTPGRQRGYILHFSQPKQAATRYSRIDKCKSLILEGVGLHDGYRQ